jgi:hypothetical protein
MHGILQFLSGTCSETEVSEQLYYINRIKQKFNLPQDEIIVGFIDADYTRKGDEGVLITRDGIQWIYSQVKIDEKEQGKGSFTFVQLSNYSCSAKTKFIRNGITLSKMNINDVSNLVIEIAFLYDAALGDEVKEEQVYALEKVFATLTSVYTTEIPSIPDEKNGKLIETFIDDDKEIATFYKKAFVKYTANGIEKFAFCFSKGGLVFGVFNLIHRKLYFEGIIWLVLSAILGISSGGFLSIISWVTGAFLNPFLIYKRYKRILRQCDTANMNIDQKIETLRKMGGTNPVTSAILGITWLVVLIFIIIAVIRIFIG